MPISEHLARLLFTPGAPPVLPPHLCDDAVIRSAAIHGVGPLLALRSQNHEVGLSAGVATWAADQLDQNLQRHALLREHLTDVLDAFRAAEIEIIPLKGAALLLRDGADVAWRPMADLDVLITVPHQRAVDLALAHAGFCLSGSYNTGWSGLAWKHLEYQLCDHSWPPVDTLGEHRDLPRKLEAHFAVRELYRGLGWNLTDYILNDVTLVGEDVVPGDHALALHFTVHASFAIFERKVRLSNLLDLQQLLTSDAVQMLADIVRAEGARKHARFIYPAVALLARYAPTPLLDRFAAALRHYIPRPLATWLQHSTLAALSYEAGRGQPWLLPDSYLATSRGERLKLAVGRWLPLPRDLSNAGYSPSSRTAMLGWYQDYYRRQLRRRASRGAVPLSAGENGSS